MSFRPILATVLAALAFSAEVSAKTHDAGAKSYNVSDADRGQRSFHRRGEAGGSARLSQQLSQLVDH